MNRFLIKILFLPALLAVGLGVLAILLGRKIPRVWAIAICLVGVVGFILRSFLLVQHRVTELGIGYDFGLFWKVGTALWEGQDPYQLDLRPPFLYPLNAPPLMALLALLPEWTSDRVLSLLNIAAAWLWHR